MQESIIYELEAHGHAFVEVSSSEHASLMPILAVYAMASLRISAEDIISSINPRLLKRRSLSATYGLSEFPLHTDRAHDIIPPRFVLLSRSSGTAQALTRVMMLSSCNLQPSHLAVLRRDVWYVRYGRQRFLTSILNDTLYPSQVLLRYDPCCMEQVVATSKAAEVMRNVFLHATTNYELTEGKTLILDNWKVMHGRSSIEEPQALRSIYRTLVSVV